MKITKIKINNCYGIEAKEITPSDVNIITGKNGQGKTSILDAIATTFTNKKVRTDLIKKGSNEAVLYIKTDSDMSIARTKKIEGSDKVSVVVQGHGISSPENYLKELYSDTQINPLAFLEMKPREQQKILLNLTKIDYTLEDVKNTFGEVPPDWSEDKHVLENLDYIQGNKSTYWERRAEANRNELFQRQSIEKQQAEIPVGYDAEKWAKFSLADEYEKLEKVNVDNAKVERAQAFVDEYDEKIKNIDNIEKAETSEAEKEFAIAKQKYESTIKEAKAKTAEAKKTQAELLKAAQARLAETKHVDPAPISSNLKKAEEMKGYLELEKSIQNMEAEAASWKEDADKYDDLINRARLVPAELLKKAQMPIDGMSIEDGELLINGLHLDSLSDGEKLKLALEVAKTQASELNVVLADGFEKLDPDNQKAFIKAAKESGLQYFITSVTDGELTVRSE